MNTYTKFFLALCCSGTIVSCSNDLDEKVYSKITEQTYNYTVDDFSPSIASVYSQLRSFPSHGGYFTTQEVSADAIVMPPNASGWDDGGVYRRMHYQTWNSEQGHVSEIWSNFYQGALLCNKVIEQIENGILPASSEADKTMGLAELRAMRAYYYWQICDNFGDAPLVTTTTMELPSKSNRKEIFDFIVKELKEIIPSLSEEQGGNFYGRMNKWAANFGVGGEYHLFTHWGISARISYILAYSGEYSVRYHHKEWMVQPHYPMNGSDDISQLSFSAGINYHF